jgi:hypothetical protein
VLDLLVSLHATGKWNEGWNDVKKWPKDFLTMKLETLRPKINRTLI